ETLSDVTVVLSVIVVCLLLGSAAIYRHYRREAQLASMTWKIKWEDITVSTVSKKMRPGSRISLTRISLTNDASKLNRFPSDNNFLLQHSLDFRNLQHIPRPRWLRGKGPFRGRMALSSKLDYIKRTSLYIDLECIKSDTVDQRPSRWCGVPHPFRPGSLLVWFRNLKLGCQLNYRSLFKS
ncbi:hypothetical protein AVEN_19123-1, partial [Araneus ventricosus]